MAEPLSRSIREGNSKAAHLVPGCTAPGRAVLGVLCVLGLYTCFDLGRLLFILVHK